MFKSYIQLPFVDEKAKLNASYYVTKLLPNLIKDCRHLLSDNFIFQQNGAPAHTAAHAQDWIKKKCPGFVGKTRKPSCRWQTRATPTKSLHGLRQSSGVVVSCIASLLIDSVPMVYYYVLDSNCVCKMRRFGDTRLLKLLWPWNPGQGSLKVTESDTIR